MSRSCYQVVNLLGQAGPARGGAAAPCPPVLADDPTLNCMRAHNRGVVCSDGRFYPAGCPSPEITEDGIALYDQRTGVRIPVPPPARMSLAKEVGPGFPWLAVAIAAAGGIAAVVF